MLFFFFQVKNLIAIHRALCPNFDEDNISGQLSCDGMSESLSTSVSLDVYSIKFTGCQKIYPIRIVRPLKKFKIDPIQQLSHVIHDLNDNNFKIKQFIGDNPKRAIAKECLCFSSWYPCEYCFAKGTKIVTNSSSNEKEKKKLNMQIQIVREKIDSLQNFPSQNTSEILKLKTFEKELIAAEKKIKEKKSNIVWPKTSMNAPLRTREEILKIIEKIENNIPMSIDEAKGVCGRSLLFDLPYFNFVSDNPVEYLHCVCLGVVKRCVELTFTVGENRPRVTKRKLSSPIQFNIQILHVKVVHEFSRRIRELDFAVYKGQEFRNLLLFFFPLVLNCIEPSAKERHLWLHLTFVIKACVLPKEEFSLSLLPIIEKCLKCFYSLYQQLFGVRNCTYNTHCMGSHLIDMRYHGPLTCTSAFTFESFYGEIRNSFVPGTVSTLKQIMSNVLIKRAIAEHKCKNEIYISPKETPLECNNLVYSYKHHQYNIYKVDSIEGNILSCFPLNTLTCRFNEIPSLKWEMIGVFKKGLLSDEMIQLDRKNVHGKVLLVQDYLITCPTNVLLEK